MFEKSQVQRSPNKILSPLLEYDMSSIIALVERLQDKVRIIRDAVVMTLHIADLVSWRRKRRG